MDVVLGVGGADAHLVQEPAPGRYRVHDLLRRYAADLAEAARAAIVAGAGIRSRIPRPITGP